MSAEEPMGIHIPDRFHQILRNIKIHHPAKPTARKEDDIIFKKIENRKGRICGSFKIMKRNQIRYKIKSL